MPLSKQKCGVPKVFELQFLQIRVPSMFPNPAYFSYGIKSTIKK
jgi:hypothetical protein